MPQLLRVIRRLALGVGLIVAASAVLLLSDPRRKTDGSDAIKRVAVVSYTSTRVFEDGERGLLDGLAEEGFIEGRNLQVVRYNAEGDRATAAMIANEVVGRDFDVILTLSTPTLQAVANANKTAGRTHVFTLTTDPWGAGVGISRENHLDHPPYMTGHGSLQPVESLFRMARQAKPDLQKVGVVWNPLEANSEASTLMAREACRKLGIELIEVTVDTSAGVAEAAKAVVTRGAQAIWVGGDSTVAVGFDALVAAARAGRVPVFSNMPGDVKRGALLGLGADYYEVGRTSGLLAAQVLRGESPANVPVENVVPEQLAVNTTILAELEQPWKLPADWISRAEVVVDEVGIREKPRTRIIKPVAGRTYQIAVVSFAPDPVSDATLAGLKAKLHERGFEDGKNLQVLADHAQGDISLIPSILQKHDQSSVDLIVTFTTPCLAAACSAVKNKPVVFTEVYDPIAAGAGKSASEHLPHITGVGSFPPLEAMIEAMRQLKPGLKAVGTVYNNSEANSRKVIAVARELCRAKRVRLEEVTVANSSEVLQATLSLTQGNVEVLWEVGDNTVTQGLEGMIKAASQAGLPVVHSDPMSADRGVLIGAGISFYESGYAAGELVSRVLTGESPAGIPFQEVAVVRLAANLQTAKQLRFVLPADLLKQCTLFYGIQAKYGRAASVAMVQLVEGPTLDSAADGVLAGLKEAGLRDGTDFELEINSAQGDMAQLPLILANVKSQKVDLIITSTTPAMIAAARATRDIPIVFTVASYPPTVGVFPEGQRQKNLVGVYDDPPLRELIELAQKREGQFKKVGIVWNPAEPNSEYSVKKLRRVCADKSLELIERHAAAVAELPHATAAVCQAAQVFVISADNVTSSGFPVILNVTRKHHVPLYSTEPDMVRRGATGGVGDDFYEWGKQTGRMAAKVLAGVSPGDLPFEKTAVQRTIVSEDAPLGR